MMLVSWLRYPFMLLLLAAAIGFVVSAVMTRDA